MARKTLEDFNYDYQAYADYLESPQCANDEGYDTYVDYRGNIYESDDWTKGHGHRDAYGRWEGRDKDDPESSNHPWKNPWLKYAERLDLTEEEVNFLNILYVHKNNTQTLEDILENNNKKTR